MKKTAFIAAFIALAVIISCDQKKGLMPAKATPIPANACDSIKYSNAAKLILDNNCAGCHGAPFASGGVDLSNYSGAQAKALDGRIKDRITNINNPMPPGGLMPQGTIDSIMCWIDKGAPL